MRYAMMLAAGLLFLAPAVARADDCRVIRPCDRRIVVVERPRPSVVIVERCRPRVRVVVRPVRFCR
jgi:hypothetical protein